jgi:hypothetical protein
MTGVMAYQRTHKRTREAERLMTAAATIQARVGTTSLRAVGRGAEEARIQWRYFA